MGYRGALRTFQIRREQSEWSRQSKEPARTITFSGPKATVAAWAACDEYLVTGHEDGKVALYYHDSKEPESGIDSELEEQSVSAHEGVISDIQMSRDRTYCITSGKDKTAKVRHYRLAAPDLVRQSTDTLLLLPRSLALSLCKFSNLSSRRRR